MATDVADDSQSDVSIPSDVDEDADADADNSDLSDSSPPSPAEGRKRGKANGNGSTRTPQPRPDVTKRRAPSPPIARSDAAFTASKATELMRNGLTPSNAVGDEPLDFETGSPAAEPPSAVEGAAGRPESLIERRRREHEDYKKKRDADPAFIPNRGAFFMHDQRSAPGQNGFRQFGPRGGARGGMRGAPIGGPFSPAK